MVMFVRLTDNRMFELNHWTNFDEICYENYVIADLPKFIISMFLLSVKNNNRDAPLPKFGETNDDI